MITSPKNPPKSITEAWSQVLNLNSGAAWIPIPSVYGFPSNVGISNGVFCTRRAAQGMQLFIARLNSIGEK